MSFFGALAGLGQGMADEGAYLEKVSTARELQAEKNAAELLRQRERAQDRADQITLMASLREPRGGGKGGGSFNLYEEMLGADTPERQERLIALQRAVGGDQNGADALAEAYGRPRMGAVNPTAGDFARFDRQADPETGVNEAAVPQSYIQRAQYDRDKGALALQRVMAVAMDPAKLKSYAEGEGQMMVNDQVRGAIESGSDKQMREAGAASLTIGAKDRFTAVGNAVVDKAGVAAPEAAPGAPTGNKPPSGYRYTPDGNLEAIPGGPGDKKPSTKPLPSSLMNGLLENQTGLRRAQSALALITGDSVEGQTGDINATGIKGYLPNQLLNRFDPAGVDTRAAIADLGSLVIHDRSGAAVTAAEFPRLAPFIPSEKDDAETAKKKLKSFVRVYEAITKDAVDFYTASGYNVPAHVLRDGKGDSDPTKGSGNVPRARTPAEVAKLPSGALFIAPDGSQRRKP